MISDKFPFPVVNKSGLVYGKDFNKAMEDLRAFLKFYTNMGAYIVHPDQVAGAMPDIASALRQAKEIPAGWPIVINLVPKTEYDEDVEIPQDLAEDHDIYFMNPFEDYTDSVGTIEWKGSLTLPEIHPWPARQKMINLFGVQTKDFTVNMDSGWAMNLRRALMDNLLIERTHQAEGARVWAHDSILRGNFRMRDLDSGSGSGQVIFSHCYMDLSDTEVSSFIMNGSYPLYFIQCFCQGWATSGDGIFDLRPPVGSYNGHIYMVDTSFYFFTGINKTVMFADAGNASISWQGMNVIQHIGGPSVGLDLGAFANTYGWPNCRWSGNMPDNPPRGTRASDDKNDYRDKTWSGSAWV